MGALRDSLRRAEAIDKARELMRQALIVLELGGVEGSQAELTSYAGSLSVQGDRRGFYVLDGLGNATHGGRQ